MSDTLYYRYITNSSYMPALVKCRYIKSTPKGVWVYDTYGMSTKWVSNTSKKRFCYPTIDEARKSYLARRMRRLVILRTQLNSTIRSINAMDDLCGLPRRNYETPVIDLDMLFED